MPRMEIELAVRGLDLLEQAAQDLERLAGESVRLARLTDQVERASPAWQEYTRQVREAARAQAEFQRAEEGLGAPPPPAAPQAQEAAGPGRGLADYTREAEGARDALQELKRAEEGLGAPISPRQRAGEPEAVPTVSGPPMSAGEIAKLKRQLQQQGLSPEMVAQAVAAAPRETGQTVPVRGAERRREKDAGLESEVKIPVGAEQRVLQLEQALTAARARGIDPEIRDTEAALARQRNLKEKQRARETGMEPAPEAPAGPAQQAEHLRAIQPQIEARGTDAEKADLKAALTRAEERARRQSAPPEEKPLRGPFQRVEELKTRRDAFSGSDAGRKDLDLALKQAERAARRGEEQLTGKPFEKRLLELIGTTRLGFGAHGFEPAPLLNRVGMLFGEGEAGAGLAGGATGALAGAGIGIALAVATTGLKLFGEALQGATERANALRAAGLESGGTPAEVSRLTAMGVGAEQTPGLSGTLRERVSLTSGNVFAMQAAGRAGIAPQLPAEFGGSQDNSRIFLQALDYLHQLRGSELQLVEARRLGLEALLPLASASERLWEAEKRLGEQRERALGGKMGQDAAELSGESRRLGEEWDLLKQRMATPFLEDFGDAMYRLGNVLEGLEPAAEGAAAVMKGMFDYAFPWVKLLALKGKDDEARAQKEFGSDRMPGGKSSAEPGGRSRDHELRDRQIQATEKNTAAQERMADLYKIGLSRSSERTEQVLLPGVGLENQARALEAGAYRRGRVL